MNGNHLVSVLLFTLCANSTLAAELTEDVFLADLPTVLTASRIEQSPLDAPAPVTVIDRETIRDSGFTEIHDLLRLVPGFQVADWGGGGAVVANHGFGTGYPHSLLVLLDGRSVVNPVTGDVDWQSLPVRLDDIERIEVVRGPNQASYGAAAFNGVVNIITRLPGDEDGGLLSIARGEHGFADNYLRLSRRGERFDWRISASSRTANPFEDQARPGYYRAETNSRRTLRAELAFRPGVDQELLIDLGLANGKDEVGSVSDPVEEPYRTRKIDNTFVQLAWRRNYAPGSESTLRYYHYEHDKQEPFPYPGVNLDVKTRRDDLEWQWLHQYSEVLQGVWGVGVRQDWIDSPHYFYGKGALSGVQWQAFGNLDWRFSPEWLLHLGAMVERHYNTGQLFSPRVSLNYALSRDHSVRVSMGKGYRAPTLLETEADEVYFDRTTDAYLGLDGLYSPGGIEPEEVLFGEVGYVGHFKELGLDVDARLYTERYSGIIWNPGLVYRNIPQDARVRGGELALDWRHKTWGRVRLAHAIIGIGGDAGIDGPSGMKDDVLDSAPQHSTSLLWSKTLPWGLMASLGYYQVGNMAWLGDGNNQPAYERVDVRLAKRFGKPAAENEIALTVQNANGRHLEFLSGTDANYTERQAFVTLRLSW